MNDRMPDSANCTLIGITISPMKRVTVSCTQPPLATSADASDEKDQADGSLLSGFRSGPPSRPSSNAADFSLYTGDWLDQGETEIVQGPRRREISVSVFVLLVEFNRQRSKAIRILAGRRVTRF